MTIVEKVLEKRLRRIVKVDKMQLGFMPGKRMTDYRFHLLVTNTIQDLLEQNIGILYLIIKNF